jgi:hypothetical protein
MFALEACYSVYRERGKTATVLELPFKYTYVLASPLNGGLNTISAYSEREREKERC